MESLGRKYGQICLGAFPPNRDNGPGLSAARGTPSGQARQVRRPRTWVAGGPGVWNASRLATLLVTHPDGDGHRRRPGGDHVRGAIPRRQASLHTAQL